MADTIKQLTAQQLEEADTVTFMKFLAVRLADIEGWPRNDPYLLRLINITRAMEAEALPAAPNLMAEPDAQDPTALRSEMADIIRQAYIGHTGSRVKADTVAGRILETLEKFYMQAERDGLGGQVQ